jgi:hypothetical protein
VDGAQTQELRTRWSAWAQSELGGAPEQVEAATRAALDLLSAGGPEGQAVLAARAAWAHATPTAGPVEPGHVRGRVAGFQQRGERRNGADWTIWSFRVEHGSEPSVAVFMEAREFAGAIRDGDEVDLEGPPRRRGTRPVKVRELDNLTSGVRVRVERPSVGMARATVVGRVLATAFAFAILGALAAIVVSQL